MADELILERFGLRHTNTWGTHHVIWLTNECIFFKIARGGKSTLIIYTGEAPRAKRADWDIFEKSDKLIEIDPNGFGLDAVLFWASGTQ